MAILDIILLICFVPAIVTGISRGFVRQLAGFVAIIAGAWAAFHFSSFLSAWLSQYLTWDVTVLHIVSFVLIVLVIVLLFRLLGGIVSKFLKELALGWINGMLGVLFSIVNVALVLGILILAFEGLNATLHLVPEGFSENAPVYEFLRSFAETIFPALKSFVTGINE